MKRLFLSASLAVGGLTSACATSDHLNPSWAAFARSHSAQPASVGVRVAAATLALPVPVYEVDMSSVNAFSFFPNRIAVSRGLVEQASEFALLFVLAHELGHIEARDGDEKPIDFGDGEFFFVRRPQAKQQEAELAADLFAARYLAKLGLLDPVALRSVFAFLAFGPMPEGSDYESHPSVEDRLKNLAAAGLL